MRNPNMGKSLVDLGKTYAEIISVLVNNRNVSEWRQEDIRYKELLLLYSNLCQLIDGFSNFKSGFIDTHNSIDFHISYLKNLQKDLLTFSESLFRVTVSIIDMYEPEIAFIIQKAIGKEILFSSLIPSIIENRRERNNFSLEYAAALLRDYYNSDGFWEIELDVKYYFYLIEQSLPELLFETQSLLSHQILDDLDSMLGTLRKSEREIINILLPDRLAEDIVGEKDYDFDISNLLRNSKLTKFKSCLLANSVKDKEFALRIYRDLQRAGVSVFYTPNDIVLPSDICDEPVMNIDNQDCIILLCSKNSLESSWAKTEIMRTLAKQIELGQRILILVLLDGYFFVWTNSSNPLSSPLLQEQIKPFFVADFRDQENYAKEFQKLLITLEKSVE